MKSKAFLALLLVTILGLLLRIHNLSPYLVYPDSYQNLMVAGNLSRGQGLVGNLGSQGMLYPDVFWWTRPLYALLISGLHSFGLGWQLSASAISLTAGLAAIPIAYLLCRKIWGRQLAGLTGAVLVALSFNHIVWGGFILTETVGVLTVMLLLLSLWNRLSTRARLGDWQDWLTGVLLAVAVLARYEYAALIIPITYLVYQKQSEAKAQLVNIATGTLFMLGTALLLIGPLPYSPGSLFAQVRTFLLSLLVMVLLLAVLLITKAKAPKAASRVLQIIARYFPWLVGITAAVLIIQGIGGGNVPGYHQLSSLRNFAWNDFLLSLLFIVGLGALLRVRKYRPVAVFCLLSIVILAGIYYEVNPEMQRYWTHMIPFLLIPAVYGALKMVELIRSSAGNKRTLLTCAAAAVLLLQTGISYKGGYHWKNGLWFQPGYEQVSAEALAPALPAGSVIIVSMPEPYHFFTGISTRSLSEHPPYFYIDDLPPQTKVEVVLDMGTRQYFPDFYKRAAAVLLPYKAGEYKTGVPFRIANQVIPEDIPVQVYRLSASELLSSFTQP